MPSENMHLYDNVKNNWYKIALESDIQQLISSMDNNELQLIPSEHGSRGLRYWNGKLEYSTNNGVTWVEIQTGGGTLGNHTHEIADINTLQDKLDAKADENVVNDIQQDIVDLQNGLSTTVKTINGNKPDVNGNINIQADGTSITIEDVLASNSSTNALSANMGRELNEKLTTHEAKIDVVNGLGHVQIDDVTIKLNTDGKIYSVGGGSTTNVIDDLTSTSPTDALSANQGKVLKDLIDTKTSLPISGDDITDTTSRVLVTPNQRAQIDANTTDITSHSQRISTLEQTVGNITSTDEKVKMNSNDANGYLEEKLDGVTIQNINNKIVAKGLDGLTATIEDLNLLAGATSNIQAQINALNSVGNFSTSVNTHANLATLTPNTNDMVIVISDETQSDSPSTIYIYNGTSWVYSGKFTGGQIRDFTANPINLDTETTNILPKSKYEKQSASETPITDASGNLNATNVEDALVELFTYANNIKSIATVIGSPLSTSDTSVELNDKMQQLKALFANNLTKKGVVAYPYNTVEEMINKILTIPTIELEGTIKKISKLNVTAPYRLEIPLTEKLQLSDITTTPFEFVAGATGVVHYNLGFDNGDATDFTPNDKVEFDGVMKLKTEYEFEMTKNDQWTDEGSLHSKKITRADWLRIDKMNVLMK